MSTHPGACCASATASVDTTVLRPRGTATLRTNNKFRVRNIIRVRRPVERQIAPAGASCALGMLGTLTL